MVVPRSRFRPAASRRASPRAMTRLRGPRNRRGSTILLVITILSLLVLLAISLSFSSRMEMSASQNFGVGVQNRTAGKTAVEAVAINLQRSLPVGALSPLDLTLNEEFLRNRPGSAASRWRVEGINDLPVDEILRVRAMENASISNRADLANSPRPIRFAPLQVSGVGEVVILDASARVNVNAADESVLAGLFNEVAREAGLSANGPAIARAIVAVRLGPDGAPGQAGQDDSRSRRHSLANEARFAESLGLHTSLGRRRGATADRSEFDEFLRAAREPAGHGPALMMQRAERRRDLLTMIDDPGDYVADIRLPGFGDDVRFGSLGDLLNSSRIRAAGLTPDLLDAAAPYLTIFSTSVEERLVDLDSAPFVDLNRAGPEEIFEALSEIYPDRNPRLLQQFAVNLVDARDFDSIPTVYPGTSGPDVILGVERTPFITEIYPDSITPNEEGDEGQFLELHNPWDEQLDVNGWTVRGPGGTWTLHGFIAPGGFLVLTDDIDNRRDRYDRHTPGTGSLYDIFRILPDGNRRRAIEAVNFNIPAVHNSLMTYELRNNEGNLIDSFTFLFDQRYEDSMYSWQRENPMVRHAVPRHATPFALPPRSADAVDGDVLARLRNYPPDAPFTTPVDALRVFAGFADPNGREGAMWAFPVLGTPTSASSSKAEEARRGDRLDARLLDVFSVTLRPLPDRREWARLHGRDSGPKNGSQGQEGDRNRNGVNAPRVGPLEADSRLAQASLSPDVRRILENEGRLDGVMSREEFHTLLAVESGSSPAGVVHGRVNLNTADPVVLAALPGISREAANRIYERRLNAVDRAGRGTGEDAVIYRRYSDLLVDDELWGNATDQQRLARLELLLPHVALNSRAFLLVGQPRIEAPSDRDQQRAARVEALVALDRGTPEILYLRNVNPRP